MDREILLDYLNTYTEEELFYKECGGQRNGTYNTAAGRVFHGSRAASDGISFGSDNGVIKKTRPDSGTAAGGISFGNDNDAAAAGEVIPGSSLNTNSSIQITRHCRYMPPHMHSHEHFGIIYVVQGICRHQIGDGMVTMQEGDLCLLSPHTIHSVYAGADDIVLCILFGARMIESFFSSAPHGSDTLTDFLRNSVFLENYASYLLFHTKGDSEVRSQILDMYMEELQADAYTDRIIAHMLMVLFIRLVRKYKPTSRDALHAIAGGDTSRILRYVQENYASASLEELAGLLNYSVPYCSKYVRMSTGLSFSALLRRVRLQKAIDYLQNTDLSVDRISERIGYANPENFMRMFKKEYGISPSQYRGGGYLEI